MQLKNIPSNADALRPLADNPLTFSKAEQPLNIPAHPLNYIPDRLRFSTVLMPLSENAASQPCSPTEIGVEGSSTDDKLLQPLKASASP